MRQIETGPVLKVRAVAGLHVVVLAWDFVSAPPLGHGALPAPLHSLLGFAIEREELGADGEVVERYMLRGTRRFESKDQGLPAGTPVPLDEHPIQSFVWADHTARPATRYAYRVIPVHGTPKNLTVRTQDSTRVPIETEPEVDPSVIPGAPRHDLYVSRGAIASQAYARRFGTREPHPGVPTSTPMRWLSRGLFEALLGFIGGARDQRFGLRAAFHEFRYQPVANAFRRAAEGGAQVRIVYDAEGEFTIENIQALKNAGLYRPGIHLPRHLREGVQNNNFIVLLRDGAPIAVWTGSVTISACSLFGQASIGHVVWDPAVGRAYLEYWERLAANLPPERLRAENRAATPLPDGGLPATSVLPVFSPRDEADGTPTLEWYAARMAEADQLACLSVGARLDDVFLPASTVEREALRYIIRDDELDHGESVRREGTVLWAGGGRLDDGALAAFLEETGNPINSNEYRHPRFLLVDPLGDDPLVVTGSGGFCRPSQWHSDENMLVIRGDTRVADIYFSECMRILDHHQTRHLVRRLEPGDRWNPDAGYLRESAEEWVRPHFDGRSYQSRRRAYLTREAAPA